MAGALLTGLSLGGCSQKTAPGTEAPPSASAFTWSRCEPEAEGIDSGSLVALMNALAGGDYGLHSVLVVRHGCIVLDADFFPYDGARPHDIASCTKSLTSLAVGLALAQGRIASVDDTLADHLPGRTFDDPAKGAITLADLLTMRSGLACDSDPQVLSAMTSAPDWLEYALGLPLTSTPGTNWQYCSADAHLLSGVVTAVTGLAEDEFLERELFAPLGAERPFWPSDPQGLSHGWGDARVRPEDLARLGLLMLHGGKWNGAELVSASWLDAATRNQVGNSGPASGYGYLWWPLTQGFQAAGRGGQYLVVLPALDLVLVTTGAADSAQLSAQSTLENAFLASIASDSPLPRNPAAVAELEALVDAARTPPSASSVSMLPPTSAWVSGQRFELESNFLGWTALTLSFGESDADLSVVIGDAEAHAAVGLDGVPRVTREIPQFAADERYEDLDIALRGSWTDEQTFEITFDTLDRIDAGAMRFEFADGALKVTIHEKTYLDADLTFNGTSN